MKTKTLVNKLARLPALYEEISKYHTSNTDEQVKLGLVTEEEDKVRHGFLGVISIAHQAKEAAERSIERPDIMPHYPPEYRELAERAAVLKKFIDADKEVRDILYSLMPSQFWGDSDTPYGIKHLANQVWGKYKKTESPLTIEYYVIVEKMERKEREGSKVKRIRREVWGNYNREREALGNAAYQAVLNKHRDIVDRHKEIERLIKQRRKEKTEPIYREIADILRSVL